MTALLLALLDLAFIGSLPHLFFRRGRLHLRWWLTAAPFFLAATAIIAGMSGWIVPVVPPESVVGSLARLAGTALCAASIALIGFTLGTHRRPVSLWHQDADSPDELVTWGAYARIRHPFYTAFLLGLLGCVGVLPHPVTAVAFAGGAVQLARTAAREERRLSASRFGAEYREYRRRTRRFLPRLRHTS